MNYAATLEDQIRAVYARIAAGPGAWVSLLDIREALRGTPRADVDQALRNLLQSDDIRLEPEPMRWRITADQDAAAIRIGGEDRHLIAIL
jgi:hypothetical protein